MRRAISVLLYLFISLCLPLPVKAQTTQSDTPAKETILNTDPTITAFTINSSYRKPAFDPISKLFNAVDADVRTLLSFSIIGSDGKPKTTFPDLKNPGSELRCLFDNTLPYCGMFKPYSIQVVRPQTKENSQLQVQYAEQFCSWFEGQNESDKKKKVNEEVIVSEKYPDEVYDSHAFGQALSAISGSNKGIPSLNFTTQPKEFFFMNSEGKPELKPEYYGLLQNCGAETGGLKIKEKLINTFGAIGSAKEALPVHAPIELVKAILGIPECLSRPIKCYEMFISLYAQRTVSVIQPGFMDLTAAGIGGKDLNDPNIPQDVKDNRGAFNAYLPKTLQDRGVVLAGDNQHGDTVLTTQSKMEASPQTSDTLTTEIPYYRMKQYTRSAHYALECAPKPYTLIKKDGDDCNPTDDTEIPPGSIRHVPN